MNFEEQLQQKILAEEKAQAQAKNIGHIKKAAEAGYQQRTAEEVMARDRVVGPNDDGAHGLEVRNEIRFHANALRRRAQGLDMLAASIPDVIPRDAAESLRRLLYQGDR